MGLRQQADRECLQTSGEFKHSSWLLHFGLSFRKISDKSLYLYHSKQTPGEFSSGLVFCAMHLLLLITRLGSLTCFVALGYATPHLATYCCHLIIVTMILYLLLAWFLLCFKTKDYRTNFFFWVKPKLSSSHPQLIQWLMVNYKSIYFQINWYL